MHASMRPLSYHKDSVHCEHHIFEDTLRIPPDAHRKSQTYCPMLDPIPSQNTIVYIFALHSCSGFPKAHRVLQFFNTAIALRVS